MPSFFPAGPMCSLRGALLRWLMPAFLLVGAVTAAFSYWTYGRMVDTFMDDQMRQLAQSVGAQPAAPVLPASDPARVHEWGVYVTQVWDAQGRLETSSLAGTGVGHIAEPGFRDVEQAGQDWRVFVLQTGSGRTVQVLQSGEFRSHLAAERAGFSILPLAVLLPLLVLALWGVAGAMSRAVQEIGSQAARQDEHTIAELPLERVPHEIRPLVQSFNSLLARLRDAFGVQRRFVQDAAHELRTPITAVALQLENVRRDLPPSACRDTFGQLEAGVARAQRLVDQLLRLSRHESAGAEAPAALDLREQARESVGGLIALADQRGIDLGMKDDAPGSALAVRCAAGDLRSVLDNLIENALRYTPRGGVVDVRLAREGDASVVEVIDSGPGIPAADLPRVFDRFFRVAGTGTTGSGLGLAIARGAAQRCGMRVSLANRRDASGLIARVESAA